MEAANSMVLGHSKILRLIRRNSPKKLELRLILQRHNSVFEIVTFNTIKVLQFIKYFR